MTLSPSAVLALSRDHAVSVELLRRSNSATPAVSSAGVSLERFAHTVRLSGSAQSRSSSATPAVVVVPVVD